jgi:peptidoglycan/xylan/chitin deacetylase (PgdA/CDA1 family)
LALIALKVDVDTWRGTAEGVPRLLALFERLRVAATFLFSVGPDHTGWALRRVFRPGFLAKVSRTSVVAHYGVRTLLYGVLLPAPDIGRRAGSVMRSALAAGHECGLHCWDHVLWQDNVRRRDVGWTERQMQLAFDRYVEIFGQPPATHGAAGWQMNDAALCQIDAWRMPYASDGRGAAPFFPRLAGRVLRHVQLPTTLPTFDELIGAGEVTASNVADALAQRTEGASDQVFTLHAELEGGQLLPSFEALLGLWRAQGHELVSLGRLHRGLDLSRVPARDLGWGEVAGRSGELLVAV